MGYVLGEMLVWAVAFTISGLVIGWLVWGSRRRTSVVPRDASDVQQLRTDVERRDKRIVELEREVTALSNARSDADDQLTEQKDQISRLDAELAQAHDERDDERREREQIELRLDNERRAREEATGRLGELRRATDAEREALVTQIEVRDARISEIQDQLSLVGLTGVERHEDDLKQIVGVGPVLEQMLHEVGITTFSQVAKLTQDGLKDLGPKLAEFNGRLERERWIDQAKELHRAKYGSDDGQGIDDGPQAGTRPRFLDRATD